MKWEYMVQRLPHDQSDLEKGLDELGQKGWEMVGCGRIGTTFDTSEILLIFFKREKPEPPIEDEPGEIIVGTDFGPPVLPEPPAEKNPRPTVGVAPRDEDDNDDEMFSSPHR